MAKSIQTISVIVPKNPFTKPELQDRKHCLCALDVEKLMEWWPGKPHSPHRNANKVKTIQRILDWKRVAQIASYLLQQEIQDAPDVINKYFKDIYEPKKNEPGREWPPKISKVIGYQPSEFPTFSNVLLHLNGAKIKEIPSLKNSEDNAGTLVFNEKDKDLNFTVIDGQHRINGAFLAIKIQQSLHKNEELTWEIPAEIFLDLDEVDTPPRKQAQIFIDVDSNQKKVDKSLVADLFPTARGERSALNNKERAQDIGRKLMLEIGPLVGMIQIPGIKYGVKDVITLATLNTAIENILESLIKCELSSLDEQSEFIAQCLTAWFEAAGRFEKLNEAKKTELDPENSAYQGRVLVSMITLIPFFLWKLKKNKTIFISDEALNILTKLIKQILLNSKLLEKNMFISKTKFSELGFHGSGGIGRFRDLLWAVCMTNRKLNTKKPDKIASIANINRSKINRELEIS